jgi:hypothetical protein
VGWGGIVRRLTQNYHNVPVSEPGFLDFLSFDSRDFACLRTIFETYVGEISMNK